MGRPRVRDEGLRVEICDKAVGLLERGGVKLLTTRAIAAECGVSLPTINELFGGKAGVVGAMFARGFSLLSAELHDLGEGDPLDPTEALIELAMALRSFTVRNPRLSEVMFSGPFIEFDPTSETIGDAQIVYDAVLHRVARLLPSARPRGSAKDAAIAVVGVMTGLMVLERSGTLGTTQAAVVRRWKTAIAAISGGISNSAPRPVSAR